MRHKFPKRIIAVAIAVTLTATACARSTPTASVDNDTVDSPTTTSPSAPADDTASPGGTSVALWEGNEALDDEDWQQQWGLEAWNEDLQIVTNGFWGDDVLDVVEDPLDPERTVLQVRYDEDQVTTESGSGLVFSPDVDLTDPKTACLCYDMLFPEDFDFGEVGGKLPGLFGFDDAAGATLDATTCAGPYPVDSDVCFSARLGYRTLTQQGYPEGQMFYEPIPWMNESECRSTWLCDLPHGEGLVMRTDDPESFQATTGTWTNITQQIELNDAGEHNGSLRVWYDGELVVDEQDLMIVTSDEVEITSVMFHALFGQGFDLSQGSPTTQYSYFADVAFGDTCGAAAATAS